MKLRFTKPVAGVATAILLLGACSDDDDSANAATEPTAAEDGPTTLAKGEDIQFVASSGYAEQTMDILAEEKDGEVTGEVSFEPHGSVADFQCVNTDTDGVILLGGQFTTAPLDGKEPVGSWLTIGVREGDPDSVLVWFAETDPGSCGEAIAEVREMDLTDDSVFADVAAGHDITTS